MPDLTIPEWLKTNSPYHAIIAVALLAPNLTHWNTPSTWSDLWSPTFLSLGVTLLSFVASRNNISGPLRYGVHKYGPWMQTFYEKAPDGTVWVLMFLRFLLPWTQAWVIGVVSVGWQYIFQHFREEVRNATDQANNFCARASIAASTAQAYVAEATRYELDALSNGGQVLRDARQAEGIKASDFFSQCEAAWTAIGRAADATDAAHDYSNTAVSRARPGLGQKTPTANEFFQRTEAAANSLEDAHNKAEVARDVLSTFGHASTRDQEARLQERTNATRAVGGTKDIIGKNNELSDALTKLAALAQQVRYTASMAVAAVEQGRMEKSKEHLQKAKTDLEAVEKETNRIASVKSAVRQLFITQILG